MPSCRCGAEFVWVKLPSGRLCPTDPAPLERPPAPRDVVAAMGQGVGYIVSARSLEAARLALRDDETCTLHTAHWDTCQAAIEHRAGFHRPGQEVLGI